MNDQIKSQTPPVEGASVANTFASRFRATFVSSAKTLEYWLLPGFCILCRLPSNRHLDLCRYCENDLPWLHRVATQCIQCGLPCAPASSLSTAEEATTSTKNRSQKFSVTDTKLFSGIRNKNPGNSAFEPSGAQLDQPQTEPPRCLRCKTGTHFSGITQTISPLSYQGCARWLVQKQKHSKGGAEGRVLAELLSDALEDRYHLSATAGVPELLVPVPLHWRKQWRRGHNQSALLARYIGKRLGTPVNTNLVKRTVSTSAQQSLSRSARATNLAGAFEPTDEAAKIIQSLPKGRIAIVDDVITTGSTALALANVLRKAGANEIHLLSPTRAILNA